jgi:hypothetical protein
MMFKLKFPLVALILMTATLAAQQKAPQKVSRTTTPPRIAPAVRAALDTISEESLRANLSFLASDLLEGRATPSRGLDLAAEFIASRFRGAGLEPVGDDGYFQTANWTMTETPTEGFNFALTKNDQTIALSPQQITYGADAAVMLRDSPVVKLLSNDPDLGKMGPGSLQGKILITEAPGQNLTQIANRFDGLKPAFILVVDRATSVGRGFGAGQLKDPENPRGGRGVIQTAGMIAHNAALGPLFDALPAGDTGARLTLSIPVRVERQVKLRNVIGILRGSDPILKDTYVLVTAHYDHVGMRPELEGDKIFNGANDDGSGTVSVIELATALSKLKVRPKRTLVFMTVFGEERGLLGSRYYSRHPIFPLKKTVADINLEHVGRTDDSEGSQVNRATLTGFDFSDLGPIFKAAGEATGVEVYKHAQNSDSFFGRSDNQALADAGVPAHTLCVAFIFPDYHKVGDHWDKIDYPNLARTNRMVGLALVMMANNLVAPKWNESNPKTARYVEAWRKLQESGN